MVAFRRKKSIQNFVVRSDVCRPKLCKNVPTSPCYKCKKTCHLINNSPIITNSKNGRSLDINAGGNCRTKNIIYAARCKIHDLIYIGHTGDELAQRFSKHRYDTKKRPDNNELSKHIAEYGHDFEKDIDVTILMSNLETAAERELNEDKFICKLGTKSPNGLNVDVGNYGADVYDICQHLY